jgi:hypothetical protein
MKALQTMFVGLFLLISPLKRVFPRFFTTLWMTDCFVVTY